MDCLDIGNTKANIFFSYVLKVHKFTVLVGLGFQAGFSTPSFSFSLPGSGTQQAVSLTEMSDMGIPGEWLFRLDQNMVRAQLNSTLLIE